MILTIFLCWLTIAIINIFAMSLYKHNTFNDFISCCVICLIFSPAASIWIICVFLFNVYRYHSRFSTGDEKAASRVFLRNFGFKLEC